MTNYYTPSGPKLTIYGIVILACFLVMAYLVRGMYEEHNPGPVNQARAEERAKARQELAASSSEALSKPAWADQARGLVRLPIERAMELTVQNYNSGFARSNLTQRVEKATAPLPAAPEQPSEFE